MSASAGSNRVFVSCVSTEFAKRPGARFPHLRDDIRHYLTRADCEVKIQEDFRQVPVDTLQKLDGYIRNCAVVVHIVGEKPGAAPSEEDRKAYLAAEPNFLESEPKLREALGDFSGLSYTQWEAYMALHRGVWLFVYANNADAQQEHLKRLEIAGRFASPFSDQAELFGQWIGDLREIIPALPERAEVASSRILRHSPDQLFGREQELDDLDAAWEARDRVNVYTLIAWGGAGKTSLAAHWMAKRFAARGWRDVERYFDWSFYSQGTKESSQAGADFFIAAALEFFGDDDPQRGSPWERGQRLARLVREHRTLLILDGIEPLQHPINSQQGGVLKDDALDALLKGLAASNPGLCLVTSREPLKDLETFHETTVEERHLDELSREAAFSLLRHLRIDGTDAELEAAWEDAGGHALTLHLLGRFLADAHGGDIRKRKEVDFETADRETQGRTAMKVMRAYENWLRSAGPERQRDLVVLRLMGLFDRPADAGCLAALRAEPAIAGLTEEIVGLEEWEWTKALNDLEHLDLITLTQTESQPHTSSPIHPLTVDAHPLVREYFAAQLRDNQPEAYRAGHSRLFDHLCETTEEYQPDTLTGLQPLYQAVTHGCLAGKHQEACDKVYDDRILRGTGSDGFYSIKKLGAFGADLGAVAAFFESPWSRLSPNLSEASQAWLLNEASTRLRALGRLHEARELMRASGEMDVKVEEWKGVASSYSNLSELEVTLGLLEEAVADGRRAVEFADRSEDAFLKMAFRATAADALHQRGEREEARVLFEAAEQMQAECQPQFPLLYSLRGFRYVDLLLSRAERTAWQLILSPNPPSALRTPQSEADCTEATRRAFQTLEWAKAHNLSLLTIALDHLTLARAGLYRAVLAAKFTDVLERPANELECALSGLREAGTIHHVPKALLTASLFAWLRDEAVRENAAAAEVVPEALRHPAKEYLDEAEQIAKRGPMPLYLTDAHLHRARLFKDKDELARARELINKHNYGRRREELEDTEAAAKGW